MLLKVRLLYCSNYNIYSVYSMCGLHSDLPTSDEAKQLIN